MAFTSFTTAGDSDLATTEQAVLTLAEQGVDLIEIGFPYSDPIADGPVIQASYTRALQKKLHVAEVFAAIKELTAIQRVSTPDAGALPPLLAMVAYSVIVRM